MEWYTEGVGNAIVACRQNKALFVVYVYDETNASKTTDESWTSSEVLTLMSSNKYVALRILKDSLECRQFSQLFPVLLYPSVFCIGLTGQVLVTMVGGQTPIQLRDKLAEGFKKLQAEISPPPVAPTPVEATPIQTTPTAPPITISTPRLDEESTTGVDSGPAAQSLSREEKVKRAQELIKLRREEKEEQQTEKEKNRELERREMGKEAAKNKNKHEDRQTQDWIRERQKQREDAKRAREEVKAKLEQDKLERQARASEQRERSAPTPTVSSVMSSVSTSGACRIQLKFPEGSNTVVELKRTDTLITLRERVAEEVNESVDNVILTSMYPRKELTRESDEQTMFQLQLVPSGVIIVRLKKGFVSSMKGDGSGSGVWGALTYLFQLIVWFLSFIKNAIVGLFSGGGSQGNEDSSQYQPDVRRERLSAMSGRGRERVGNEEGPRLRKFRQEDYQDESDEERKKQTYNGNSTQQQ